MLIKPHSLIIPEFSTSTFSGMLLWSKADSLALADATPVPSLPDSGPSGLAIPQATGTKQALFKTNILNGKPVFRFDGVDDFYQTTNPVSYGSFTWFFVYKSAGGMIAEKSVNAGTTGGDYHFSTGGAQSAVSNAVILTAFDGPTPLNDNVFRVVAKRYNGTDASHELYLNDVLQPKTTVFNNNDPGVTPISSNLFFGGRAGTSLFLNGDIAEIIGYDNYLGSAALSYINRMLGQKYGIF